MPVSRIIFVFILISRALLVNCGFRTEELVGGIVAYGPSYRYQVGIIGKHNNSYTRYLACSGGIISDLFILSSAECFLDPVTDELLKLRFYVILGSVNLKDNYTAAQEIIFIYVLSSHPPYKSHPISVLQLEDTLNLNINFHLKKLYLASEHTRLDLEATVAGYGFTMPDERKTKGITSRPRVSENHDHVLMCAHVDIALDEHCKLLYPFVNTESQMCGTMQPLPDLDRRGLCSYDEGAPLVIGDIVIGIANKNRKDCDNTIRGNIYSKVSYYRDFINGVTHSSFLPGTLVYRNRRHIHNNH